MNKTLFLLIFTLGSFSFITNLSAQIIVVSDTLNGWDQSWIANFNGAQSSFNNWSEGGVNTLSGTASTVFTKFFRDGRFTYGFRIHLRYGQSKINGNDIRKTDDLISIRNRVTYELSKESIYSAFGAIQFKTQFADGFDYGKAQAGGDSLISRWFAPAYFIESFGLEVKPSETFSMEIGAALKQTIVSDNRLNSQYQIDQGRNIRSEGGLTFGAQYKRELLENTEFATSIETFTNLLVPLNQTDVYWSNHINGRINRYLSTIFQFELRYDHDYSTEVQLKQVFAAGVTVNFY
ncbi:MAG: DUF3078 domain-containing protein [Balneolaceae bacterium]|nr:DUF3078 domain-containing protein [Balneolaceae bacterium]MBO6544794.1 DUF3078 domain-containing protein [Balneolaceae bacterium]MBO6646190.1 DUF3078 domain-containing protein [Balneolaceae bacterium]